MRGGGRQKRIRNLWLKVLRKQPIVDNEDHVQGIVRTMKGRIVEVTSLFL